MSARRAGAAVPALMALVGVVAAPSLAVVGLLVVLVALGAFRLRRTT